MNTSIKSAIKNDITFQLIDNNGDLYSLIAQDADSAVIYYHDAHEIVNKANTEETDYASDQMNDTGFVFESMDHTATICAYWITEMRLNEEYRDELKEDHERLIELMDLTQDKYVAAEDGSEEEKSYEPLIDELQNIIDLIEEEMY